MKGVRVDLYVATKKLAAAKDAILKEHPIDQNSYTKHPQDLDLLLLEHDKPESEVFPKKENMKPIEARLKGNSTVEDVLNLLKDQ